MKPAACPDRTPVAQASRHVIDGARPVSRPVATDNPLQSLCFMRLQRRGARNRVRETRAIVPQTAVKPLSDAPTIFCSSEPFPC